MRNQKVLLRKFEPSDLVSVLRIERLSFAIDPCSAGRFRYCYQKQPEGFIVAEKNNEVVGYIVGRITQGRGGIGSIAVEPKYRNEGIGRQLVAFILNYFKQKKVKLAKAEVRTTTEGAIKIFKSLHFQIIKTLPKYYPDGADAYLMEKKLDNTAD